MSDKDPSQQDIKGRYNAQADQGGSASVHVTNIKNVYESAKPSEIDKATLVAAETRLASLPLVTPIPDPAQIPTGSRMPWNQNPLFVGRKADFLSLAKTLKSGQTAAIGQIAAVTGLGGIGKTQFASEWVHRYGQYFSGGVFWLSFAKPETIPGQVADCGGSGGLELGPDFTQLSQENKIREVLAAWMSPLPRLLIFDNCEDPTLLTKWRPPSGESRVLMTSRRPEWDVTLSVQPLALTLLSREESRSLLKSYQEDPSHLNKKEADAIADALADLPLALHLAGSFLNRYRHAVSPEDYLAQLQDKQLLEHASLQGRGSNASPTEHELHVEKTFAISYTRLDPSNKTDHLALGLLARVSCFAPGEPIPRPLLLMTYKEEKDKPSDPLLLEDGLSRLNELGLLDTKSEGALTLHRLLQHYVKAVEPDSGAQEAVETSILVETRRLNEEGDPRPILKWQVHLHAIIKTASEREDAMSASLCNALALHLGQIASYSEAESLFQRALKIREKVLGPDHLNVAQSLNNIAELYRTQGRYEGAEALYQRALEISEKVLGPEHPCVAISLNNIALLYDDQGRYKEAEPLYQRSLEIREKALGPEHPHVATSLNNIAAFYHNQGRYEEAEPLYQRALEIREKVLGPEHPDVAQSLNNIAMFYHNQGEYEKAEPLYQRALEILEKVLGPEHPNTKTVRKNLAALLNH